MLPVAVAAVWFGGWFFAALTALACVLLLWEWLHIGNAYAPGPLIGGAVGLVASVVFMMQQRPDFAAAILLSTAAVLGFWRWHRFVWHAAGVVYIGLPLLALLWLRGEPEHGRLIVFWLFILVWATDIGAYAAGRTIGGPKLIPRISPNKTWAGLLGGMTCAAAASGLMASLDPALPVLAAAFAGAVLAVIAQAGDFTESAVKRHFNVKDSSNLIPGHGGVFDRVDGLLFAAPCAALALLLWRDRLWP